MNNKDHLQDKHKQSAKDTFRQFIWKTSNSPFAHQLKSKPLYTNRIQNRKQRYANIRKYSFPHRC